MNRTSEEQPQPNSNKDNSDSSFILHPSSFSSDSSFILHPSSLPNWLSAQAQRAPKRLALLTEDASWTFAELFAEVQSVAANLAELGVTAGDRVAVLLPNSTNYVKIVHALTLLEAVLVPLNTRLTPAEIEWQLNDVSAKLLITDRDDLRFTIYDLRLVKPSAISYQPSAEPTAIPITQNSKLKTQNLQSIIFTSGTSGQPKGVMLTYGSHWWSATGSALNLGLHRDDRWLAVLPFFHVGGLSILFRSVIYGIPAIVHPGFDAARVNRAIDEQGVTIISVVATTLQRMLDERGDRAYPASLRCVLLGGGPAPRPLLEACARRNIPVVQSYGMTEAASQIVTLAPEDALTKLGSAGQPLLPNEVSIVGEDGQELAANEVGEIVVRGPSLTVGYYNRPEATAQAFRDGWFHTGDMGRLDEDGYLYIVDRRSDLIISGGENIYPAEIEAVLQSHPAVLEVGVTGQPDPKWGQVPIAFVRLQPNATATPDELLGFAATKLARYKLPHRLILVNTELPRNANGKLLRRELRTRFDSSDVVK